MPHTTGFLVIWGTSVIEPVCNVFISCIGRWLRWTSTLSTALKIRIGGSVVKTCQHLKHGVQQTTGSTTRLGTQVGSVKQIIFLLYNFFFVWLGFFNCCILKVWAANLEDCSTSEEGMALGCSPWSLIPRTAVLILWVLLNPLSGCSIYFDGPGWACQMPVLSSS